MKPVTSDCPAGMLSAKSTDRQWSGSDGRRHLSPPTSVEKVDISSLSALRRQFRTLVTAVLGAAVIVLAGPPPTSSQEEAVLPPEQFESVEERRLYDAIQNERASIREERQELELKKKELKSIEEGVDKKLAQIDQKLEEMQALRQQIEQLLAAKSEEELKRTQDLARIYEKMSPDKAALAISGLDPQLAADLLANMKVKSAARILDQISRQKATDLSTTFSTIQLE